MGVLQDLGQLWDQSKLDKLAGQYYQQSQDDPSGRTGLASKARHTAASSAFSDKIARALGGDNPGKVAQFVGDVGSWVGGGLHELGTPRQLFTKDTWEDIKANTAGTFETEFGKPAEDIYSGIYSPALSKTIDPAGRNLFTQYYEDDPYAGIRGQTAMADDDGWTLNYPDSSIIGQNIQRPNIAKLMQMSRRKKQLQNFKNIEAKTAAEAAKKKVITKKKITTGGPTEIKSYDPSIKKTGPTYGPYKKTKVKVKAKHSPHGGGQGGYTSPKKKTVKAKAPKKSRSYQQASYARRRRADGGLINFFKNGGFLG